MLSVLPPARATYRATIFVVSSCSNMLQQIEEPSTLRNKNLGVVQHETATIVARQIARAGGKTGNIALLLVPQQCCVESCTNLLPVLPNLKVEAVPW